MRLACAFHVPRFRCTLRVLWLVRLCHTHRTAWQAIFEVTARRGTAQALPFSNESRGFGYLGSPTSSGGPPYHGRHSTPRHLHSPHSAALSAVRRRSSKRTRPKHRRRTMRSLRARRTVAEIEAITHRLARWLWLPTHVSLQPKSTNRLLCSAACTLQRPAVLLSICADGAPPLLRKIWFLPHSSRALACV